VFVIERVLEAEREANRQLPVLDEALQIGACVGRPAAAAGDDHRSLGAFEQLPQLLICAADGDAATR
jgi:hypothetical protein